MLLDVPASLDALLSLLRPCFTQPTFHMFRLWQPKRRHFPKDTCDPERPSKPVLARQMVDLLATRLTDRTIHVVGDRCRLRDQRLTRPIGPCDHDLPVARQRGAVRPRPAAHRKARPAGHMGQAAGKPRADRHRPDIARSCLLPPRRRGHSSLSAIDVGPTVVDVDELLSSVQDWALLAGPPRRSATSRARHVDASNARCTAVAGSGIGDRHDGRTPAMVDSVVAFTMLLIVLVIVLRYVR